MKARLNPDSNMEEEKALFIKAWTPLLNHPVLSLPTGEAREIFIDHHADTLENDVLHGKLNRIRVEAHGHLLLSALLTQDVSNSLKIRVLLMNDNLSEQEANLAWQKTLDMIKIMSPQATRLEMTITTGPSQHATWLKKFGFMNTKEHPESPSPNTTFNSSELERWICPLLR